MQIALLADVHGNLEALDAVLRALDRTAPQAKLVCAGDVVGYGPNPEECLARLSERGAVIVLGNHEEMVLGRRDFLQCVSAGIRAVVWTREHLSAHAWRVLEQLPSRAKAAQEVLVCHGDLHDAGRYVSDSARASRALEQLAALEPNARVLVTGHTHHQTFFSSATGFRQVPAGAEIPLPRAGSCLVNPGSVGQSRDQLAVARYALLHLERGTVTYAALDYDHTTTTRKLRRLHLAPRVVMPPPQGLARYVEKLAVRITRAWAAKRASREADARVVVDSR